MSEAKPVKVVVRCLPPTLAQEEFTSAFKGENECYQLVSFARGKTGEGDDRFTRVYLGFNSSDLADKFIEEYDRHKFVDSKGEEFKCLIEYAMFQKVIPKNKTKNTKAATITESDEYKEFVETMRQEPQLLPSAEVVYQKRAEELEKEGGARKKKSRIVVEIEGEMDKLYAKKFDGRKVKIMKKEDRKKKRDKEFAPKNKHKDNSDDKKQKATYRVKENFKKDPSGSGNSAKGSNSNSMKILPRNKDNNNSKKANESSSSSRWEPKNSSNAETSTTKRSTEEQKEGRNRGGKFQIKKKEIPEFKPKNMNNDNQARGGNDGGGAGDGAAGASESLGKGKGGNRRRKDKFSKKEGDEGQNGGGNGEGNSSKWQKRGKGNGGKNGGKFEEGSSKPKYVPKEGGAGKPSYVKKEPRVWVQKDA